MSRSFQVTPRVTANKQNKQSTNSTGLYFALSNQRRFQKLCYAQARYSEQSRSFSFPESSLRLSSRTGRERDRLRVKFSELPHSLGRIFRDSRYYRNPNNIWKNVESLAKILCRCYTEKNVITDSPDSSESRLIPVDF